MSTRKDLMFVQRIIRQGQHGGASQEDTSKALCIIGDLIVKETPNISSSTLERKDKL